MVTQSPTAEDLIQPARGGKDCRKYYINTTDAWVIVIPTGWTRQTAGVSGTFSDGAAWAWLEQHCAAIAAHLHPFMRALKARDDQGEFWWELRPCDYYSVFTGPKIVFPDICKYPRFCLDETGLYLMNTAYALGTGDKYLLGILNSRLFWFCISMISIPFGVRAGEFRYRLIYQYMEQIPIRPINPEKSADRARHDRMVALVTEMLAAKRQEAGAGTDTNRTFWMRKATTLDRQIDALVYELYDLTPAEIALVEGTVPLTLLEGEDADEDED